MAKRDETPAAGEQADRPRRAGSQPGGGDRERRGARPHPRQPQARGPARGVNADPEVRTWWHMAQVQSERLGMSDHSWVHVQIVLNIALRLLRLLVRGGVEPAMVADHGMRDRDAEVVVAGGALLHDVGMAIHRADHEAYSLFLAERKLRELLADVYGEPAERTRRDRRDRCTRSSATGAGASPTRSRRAWSGSPTRSTWPTGARGCRSTPARMGIHSISAAAIDEVEISAGDERPVRIEIEMNNSAGIFQVDDLLATKLSGTPLEGKVEVVAGRGRGREAAADRVPDRLTRSSSRETPRPARAA